MTTETVTKKAFLGGTCNDSLWRDEFTKLLKIDSFNPVVKDWNDAAQAEEVKQRQECDFVLYVITPRMEGVYSIAEVVDDSNKRPEKTVFCYIETDGDAKFSTHQLKSLKQTAKMITENGAKSFTSLSELADYLNNN